MKQLRKILALLAVLSLILLGYISYENLVYERIVILHTNDIHGHILPVKPRFRGKTDKQQPAKYYGGAAVLARTVENEKRAFSIFHRDFILIDAGDWFSGTPEGNLSDGRVMIDLFNAIGYNFLTIGNHEFDNGYDNVAKLIARSSALVVNSNTNVQGVKEYAIRNYGGVRVGFFGILTEETKEIALADNVKKLKIKSLPAVMAKLQKEFKAQDADITIGITHLGFAADTHLMNTYNWVNFVVGGHSHTYLYKPYKIGDNRAIVQAGSYCHSLGRLEIKINRFSHKVVSVSGRLINIKMLPYAPVPYIDRIINRYKAETSKKMDIVIGSAASDLRRDAYAESALGDLICDVVRKDAKADISFQNSFGIRSNIKKGDVTYRDIYMVHPFGNTIITMKLTGHQIRNILEQSATLKKGVLQLSGLKVLFDMSQPGNHRVKEVHLLNGAALDDGKEYTVATNNFVAAGGDYFSDFKNGVDRKNTFLLIRDAVGGYIKNLNKPLAYGTDGRIRFENYDKTKFSNH